MKLIIAGFVLGGFCSAYTQGTFQNLGFESATLSALPQNQWSLGVLVPITSALPGWTGYIGADQQTQVYQDTYGLGEAEIDILGPNYPAAISFPGFNPGTIDGYYSVLLQAGGVPEATGTTSASIAQTGTIPVGDQSIRFEAWQSPSAEFTVSFNGNGLSPVILGTGANYTLYGVNIAPYAGQTGQLEFTADFVTPGVSWLGLDDISFSTTAVPEPSPLILTGIGGILFGLYRRFVAKRR